MAWKCVRGKWKTMFFFFRDAFIMFGLWHSNKMNSWRDRLTVQCFKECFNMTVTVFRNGRTFPCFDYFYFDNIECVWLSFIVGFFTLGWVCLGENMPCSQAFSFLFFVGICLHEKDKPMLKSNWQRVCSVERPRTWGELKASPSDMALVRKQHKEPAGPKLVACIG